MAFNNYFPTYPQLYPQQQSYPQQSQQNTLVQWVQGINAAKSFPVAPNTSVPLFDSESNCIYIKSADASGMPSIKILDYTVRDSTPRTAEIQPQSDFVTKDELLAIQKEIDAIKADFARRKKDGKPTVRTDDSTDK